MDILGRVEARVTGVIRPCIEADLPSLEWMGLYTRHRQIIREAFEAQERGDALLLLAITAGFPIAQVWIDFARKRSDGTAVLWAVRTFYPLQRMGIGRQIMAAAENTLREHGFRRAELEVEPDNRGALHFYQKLGWRLSGYVNAGSGGTPDLEAEKGAAILLLFSKEFPSSLLMSSSQAGVLAGPRSDSFQNRRFPEPNIRRRVSK